jgi:hypothetical protein
MRNSSGKRMILCGGLQSGGTTIISWCFLQRRDTNGVLDMGSIIHASFDRITEPIVWVKMTIGAFRWLDVCETYEDLGWDVAPLLVVRDIRNTYCSLMTKSYGFNGLTAEEPPLRMRFRRFLMDWQLFRERGWSIIKFEEFLQDPRSVLRRACDDLNIPFDTGMVSWPKTLPDIAHVLYQPNRTFTAQMEKGALEDALLREKSKIDISNLPESELDWLEQTFAQYNAVQGYAPKVERRDRFIKAMEPPRFNGTRRQWIYDEHQRMCLESAELRRQLLLKVDIEPVVPAGTTFILVDKGNEIVDGEGRRSVPFPERSGEWAGYPANDAEAIAELERLRQAGADFAVFPARMFYWLDTYPGLKQHLFESNRCIVSNDRALIFDLRS